MTFVGGSVWIAANPISPEENVLLLAWFIVQAQTQFDDRRTVSIRTSSMIPLNGNEGALEYEPIQTGLLFPKSDRTGPAVL